MSNNRKYRTWPLAKCRDARCDANTHFSDKTVGEGSGKISYHGRYCWDYNHRRCVVKFYKEQYVFKQEFWRTELRTHQKAREFAVEWNKTDYRHKPIRVIMPRIERYSAGSEEKGKIGEYVLVEDYIPDFTKFNSNTMTCSEWAHKSVQAFCHWTYHHSNRKYLFCDAQGTVNKKEYVLTDPVIVSDTRFWSTSYGPCDGGKEMMTEWFRNHRCNRFCSQKWKRPKKGKTANHIETIPPTTYTTHVWRTNSHFRKNKSMNDCCSI